MHLFHVEGNLTVHYNKVSFMGVRGIAGIEKIHTTLGVENPIAKVHMAVFCMKLGKRVQVRADGYAERNLVRHYPLISVNNKLYEQSNMIHFQVKAFEGTLAMPKHLQPINNNWTITGRGTVIARVTWKNMQWTRETEEIYLAFCRNVRDIIEAAT